jgi:hypothetical protein
MTSLVPTTRGVLFDLPTMIEEARRRGGDRLNFRAGDGASDARTGSFGQIDRVLVGGGAGSATGPGSGVWLPLNSDPAGCSMSMSGEFTLADRVARH